MTWYDYQQKALSTALYSNNEQARGCCLLGLLGELGEVAELLKKDLRGDNNPIFFTSLEHEMGDLLWYSVTYLHFYNHSLPKEDVSLSKTPPQELNTQNKPNLYESIAKALNEYLQKILNGNLDSKLLQTDILTPLSLELNSIQNKNIEKLSRRKQEKKLQGSGSYR